MHEKPAKNLKFCIPILKKKKESLDVKCSENRVIGCKIWYHFHECGVLNNKFPEGVIVTPHGKICSKNNLGRTRVDSLKE